MIWSEVEKKCGKEMADIMKKSRFLNGITVKILPNGEWDIPEEDIELAFRDVNGIAIGPEEWD